MPKFGTTKIWCIGQLKLEDRGWINKKSAKMSARYPQTYDVSLGHSSPEIISNIENDVNGLTMLQIWYIGQLDSNANQDLSAYSLKTKKKNAVGQSLGTATEGKTKSRPLGKNNSDKIIVSDLIDYVNTPKFKFCHNLTLFMDINIYHEIRERTAAKTIGIERLSSIPILSS